MIVLILVGVGAVVPLASTLMLWHAQRTAPLCDDPTCPDYIPLWMEWSDSHGVQ